MRSMLGYVAYPLGLLAILLAFGISIPIVAEAGPQKKTQEILDRTMKAPGHRAVQARTLKSDKSAGTLTTVGNPPEGFGTVFEWNRENPAIDIVVYIASADTMGVAVTNVKAGDQIEILNAAGIASFSDGNAKLRQGIIGVLGLAGEIVCTIEGCAAAIPIIEKATKFAQEQYGQPTQGKRRDAFGLEGNTLRRCEGGVLVTFPSAGGVYDSNPGCVKGPDDKNGQRTAARHPDHIPSKDAFFLYRNITPNRIPSDGVLGLVAWDRKFEDNQGYYRVIFRLTRSENVPPPILQ